MVTEAIQSSENGSRERERILRTVAQTDEELATLERHQPGAPTEDAAVEMTGAILSRLEGQEKHDLTSRRRPPDLARTPPPPRCRGDEIPAR